MSKDRDVDSMPIHRVDVVERGQRARRGWKKCEIGTNLYFDTAGLEAYCLSNGDERVYDAFTVAGAIQFCDHTRARSSTGWGREMIVRIPVHDLHVWKSSKVSDSLCDALQFLTGDRWQIEFKSRKRKVREIGQLRFEIPDTSSIFIPYSDGLDSMAVASLMEHQNGHRLVRVHLGRKMKSSQSGCRKVPFAQVPFRVRYGDLRSVEASARSRGFNFALLSGVACYLARAKNVVIPESGQGALGPALVPVGQAYEDYRNHPLFTKRMERFLFELFDHRVEYIFPRLWYTKAETLREYLSEDGTFAELAATRSCWQGQRQVSVSNKMRQCGICAACLLRRMSIHALGESEALETYVWEKLSVDSFQDGAASGYHLKKAKGSQFQYAIAGTLHLDHLAALRHSRASKPAIDRQISQIANSFDLPHSQVRSRLNRLLKQHEEEWLNFTGSLGSHSFIKQWAVGVN